MADSLCSLSSWWARTAPEHPPELLGEQEKLATSPVYLLYIFAKKHSYCYYHYKEKTLDYDYQNYYAQKIRPDYFYYLQYCYYN